MASQRFWEDVQEGEEMEPLPKVATTQMLVRFAGASGDFNPLHYDDTFGEFMVPGTGIIIHGALKGGWLGHFVSQWAGEEGFVRRLACQYRGMDVPRRMNTQTETKDGETWHCKGKVTKKYEENGQHQVDLEVWVENGQGQNTTPGQATVVLPSRS